MQSLEFILRKSLILFLLLLVSHLGLLITGSSATMTMTTIPSRDDAPASSSMSKSDDENQDGALTVRKRASRAWVWSSTDAGTVNNGQENATSDSPTGGIPTFNDPSQLNSTVRTNSMKQQQQDIRTDSKQVQHTENTNPRTAGLAILGVGGLFPSSPGAVQPGVPLAIDSNSNANKNNNPIVLGSPAVTNSNCTCVPYYFCEEANVVDGGVIDIRTGFPCRTILEVCCRHPRTMTTMHSHGPTPPMQPTPDIVAPTNVVHQGYEARCGHLNPNGINARILGFKDSETQFGEYPWMAAILEMKFQQGAWVFQFVCGASLVWPNVVLTAAHCVKGKEASELTIRLGEWDTESTNEFYPYQDVRGKEIVIHPQFYGGALHNDIALVFLAHPVVLAPHIDTVCLPMMMPTNRHNTTCWATGWGKSAFGSSGSYQAILREVKLPLVPSGPCQEAFRKTSLGAQFNLHSSFVCAGGLKGLDTCVGDGGGPLVCPSMRDPQRYVLVGIVSWGVGCGTYGVPGAYVDVVQFREWIDSTIRGRVFNYDSSLTTISSSRSLTEPQPLG